MIVFPNATEDFVSPTVLSEIVKQRRRLGLAIEMPPFDCYLRLRQDLDGLILTTGLVATTFFLSAGASFSCWRVSCSFEPHTRPTKISAWKKMRGDGSPLAAGRHPEREQRLLRTRIADARAKGRNVSVPPNVERHLDSD